MDALLVKVKSSNIESVGHDSKIQTLYIKFIGGGLYSYHPVDTSTFVKLMKSESKGEYFHKNIKANKKYKVQKIA
jgi:hypothetical protein